MIDFIKSFQYAFRGVQIAWSGRNFRVQLAAAFLVVGLGVWFQISGTEWMVLMLTIGSILSMEIMNSAVEELVNFVSPEFHPLAGKIKDLAAGAVLVLSLVSVVIGLMVFYPYLIEL